MWCIALWYKVLQYSEAVQSCVTALSLVQCWCNAVMLWWVALWYDLAYVLIVPMLGAVVQWHSVVQCLVQLGVLQWGGCKHVWWPQTHHSAP